MDSKEIGKLIQSERKKLNLTQDELAKKIYVSNKAISKWETGKGIPNIDALQELAKIFNLTINEILQGKRNVKDADIVIKETLKSKRKIQIVNMILSIFVALCLCYLELVLFIAKVDKIYGILIFILFFITALLIEYISKHE